MYGKKKAAKKGLTAKQKTLPKALQQKIMKSKKKKYDEPALQDDYKTDEPENPVPEDTDDVDFEELEELSSMAGGSVAGYSLPLGAKPDFYKKKKRKNK